MQYEQPDKPADLTPVPDWTRPPVPEYRQNRFGLRTVFIPLVFILLHLVVASIVATLYLIVLLFLATTTGNQDIINAFADPTKITQIMSQHYPIITVLYSLFLIPLYSLYLFFARQRNPQQLFIEKPRKADLLSGSAMIIGALGVTTLYIALLTWLADRFDFVNRIMADYERLAGAFTPEVGFFWLIMGITILAPITEELLFRGIVQGELRRVMPESMAIVLQALIFAAYHMQPVQSSYAILPGILLGVAYAWSRSIWVPIIMHVVFNFFGSVIPALIKDDPRLGQIVTLVQLAFIAIGALAGYYMYLNRRHQPVKIPEDRSIF